MQEGDGRQWVPDVVPGRTQTFNRFSCFTQILRALGIWPLFKKKNSRRLCVPASTVRASCLASPRFWQGVLMERVCASPALVGDDRNLCPARNTCQCGYLLIIRRIANLDEEAEVVLDPILMPLLHRDLALITCNCSPAHF